MLLQSALQMPPVTYGIIFPHPSRWRLAKHNYSSYRHVLVSTERMFLQSALQVLLSVCSFKATERMFLQSALQVPSFTYGLIFPHPSSWRLIAEHNYSSYRYRHTSLFVSTDHVCLSLHSLLPTCKRTVTSASAYLFRYTLVQ